MATPHTGNASSEGKIYSNIFTFESNFSPERAKEWLNQNSVNGFLICAIYVIVIFSIKFYMRNKPRYELRTALTLWNVGLAIFSILGTLRTVPELYHVIKRNGVYDSVCQPT